MFINPFLLLLFKPFSIFNYFLSFIKAFDFVKDLKSLILILPYIINVERLKALIIFLIILSLRTVKFLNF